MKNIFTAIAFANPYVPYMFHCHLLHHEDDGMMGSFLVLDPAILGVNEMYQYDGVRIFPNPANDQVTLASLNSAKLGKMTITSVMGQVVYESAGREILTVDTKTFQSGTYFVRCETSPSKLFKLVIQ